MLILAKQHVYFCRNEGFPPSFKIFLAKVASVYQIETVISESNGKRTFHDANWKKFTTNNCFLGLLPKNVKIDVVSLIYQ